MAASLVELDEIVVRRGDKVVLQIPHLHVEAGEVLALLGPNGAGKTTLLQVVALLQKASTGSVRFNGVPADAGSALERRRRIATVFQEPLLLNNTVYQNAALGLRLRGLGRSEIARRLDPWLERLGIAHLAGRSARTLSGGEAQRTSLARALVLEPELLLLDEPFAALDPSSREELLHDFHRIVKGQDLTTIFVTHDRAEAFGLADRIGVLTGGRMLQIGGREEVFLRPASAAVAEIVGVENRLPGVVEQTRHGNSSVIALGGTEIRLPAEFPPGAKVIVCIRAEDLALAPAHCQTSDPSCFRGMITDVSSGLRSCRFAINCAGLTLVALMARKDGLAFSCGDEVAVLFRPEAVHVITDEKDR